MRILLVEDDQGLSQAMKSALAAHSIVLDVAPNISQARQALSNADYRALILDWQLPDGEGISLIAYAHLTHPGLPILMLTARGHVDDRIQGLDAGADDYITKPFDVNELLARLRAVCRRPAEHQIPTILLGSLQFDFVNRCATLSGVDLQLPRRQLLVLEALCLRAGRTVSRAKLQEAVYGFDDNIESNSLESHISRLRRTLAPAGIEIHAMRGLGYLIQATGGG